jgi:hypothetical protein
MKTLKLLVAAAVTGSLFIGCSDSEPNQPTGSTGAGASGAATTTTGSGMGGSGGMANPDDAVELSGAITADMTLSADESYVLIGVVTVEDGATLTIPAGVTIFGDKASTGTLVVKQGGKIDAQGTADQPILFTSQLPAGQRAAGDWGGLILLGKAPINEAGGTASIEGLTTDEIYGGSDAADSSGILRYVRIEFSGIEISPDNEINGLTFGGVGHGTVVDHVMVRHTLDDCYEFFGGTVNASHLVCYRNGDDSFDFDQGYVGNLQFLFAQAQPGVANDANGFECDNDATTPDVTPRTNPTIFNVTLCGQNGDSADQQYGFLFRRGFMATIGNAIVTGWEAGVDFRDSPDTDVQLSDTVFFGNTVHNVAYSEDGSNTDTEKDDDGGFDEVNWFETSAMTSETDPGLADCFAATPDPRPAAMIPGGTPSGDAFFDTTANYVGAFADANDDWMTGAWVNWGAN